VYLVLLFMAIMHHGTGHTTLEASDVVKTEAFEREIRIGLPLGSSLSTVEGFLTKRGIEFSFDASSQSVHAIARKLKGSTWLVSKSLELRFQFDDALNLRSIDTKVVFTGP
jgi:hypothetical protein